MTSISFTALFLAALAASLAVRVWLSRRQVAHVLDHRNAVPAAEAQAVADLMVEGGIRAIWNFAPIGLKVPEGVVVHNEDLAASLAVFLQKHALVSAGHQTEGVQRHVARSVARRG